MDGNIDEEGGDEVVRRGSAVWQVSRVAWFGALWLFCFCLPLLALESFGPLAAGSLAVGTLVLWLCGGYVSEGAFGGDHISTMLGMPLTWAPIIYLGMWLAAVLGVLAR